MEFHLEMQIIIAQSQGITLRAETRNCGRDIGGTNPAGKYFHSRQTLGQHDNERCTFVSCHAGTLAHDHA